MLAQFRNQPTSLPGCLRPLTLVSEREHRLGMTNPKVEDVMKSPMDLLESLLHDCQRLNPDVQGLDRDFITVKKRYEDEGYGFLTVALPSLDSALVLGLSTGRFACPRGFKTTKGGTIPRLFSGMFCKIFEPSTGLLREDADICVIKCLRNTLMLFKKMRLSPENEDKLHRKAVDAFYQCDVEAGSVIIQDRQRHHLERVSQLLLNTLTYKDVSNASYKHGPGSVEEGYRANQKWTALSNALRNGTFDASDFGFDVQAHYHNRYREADLIRLSRSNKPVDRKKLSDRRVGSENGPEVRPRGVPLFFGVSRGSARLITVLKNSTSRRTITIEPMLNQFIQQGLNSTLRESILECRILRNSLALSDQSINQRLALAGSLTDDWATIDLKSASDLLSVKLVESVFGHHGDFFHQMMDSRSSLVYSDRKEAEHMRKFAGMGNATTFPVQSVCFAAISIAAILDSLGQSPNYWNCRRASRHVRVYGDDIIVSRRYAHQCVNWLQGFGLKVNTKKSFLEGSFKESCGVDAFRGVDITPLYVKHRPDQQYSTDPNIIAGFVSLSNHMWMEGLYEASTCLSNDVESQLKRRLPIVSRGSGLLGWHTRIDSSAAHKWCRQTHQLLVRAMTLAPVKRNDRIDGYAALLKYFCTSKEDTGNEGGVANSFYRTLFPKESEPDHLDKTPIRFKSRMKSSWVPLRLAA